MKRAFLALAVFCVTTSIAHATTAADLLTACQNVNEALDTKGKYNSKKPEAIYKSGQCAGFIEGWLAGIDGAILTLSADKLAVISVKTSQIKSYWDVATALQNYLASHPLDKGKPADVVLQQVLIDAGLLTATAYHPAARNVEASEPQ